MFIVARVRAHATAVTNVVEPPRAPRRVTLDRGAGDGRTHAVASTARPMQRCSDAGYRSDPPTSIAAPLAMPTGGLTDLGEHARGTIRPPASLRVVGIGPEQTMGAGDRSFAHAQCPPRFTCD